MNYKDEIEKRVRLSKPDFFIEPEEGSREYPLGILDNIGQADFCWQFGQDGRLFIEDEDDNSQRALNNLIKYWRWCDQNPKIGPIVLIHILA